MHQKLEISVTPVPRLLTSGFVALLLTQTCFAFGFSSFFLLPKFLATRLNASSAEIGEVMGVFGVSAVVLILISLSRIIDWKVKLLGIGLHLQTEW